MNIYLQTSSWNRLDFAAVCSVHTTTLQLYTIHVGLDTTTTNPCKIACLYPCSPVINTCHHRYVKFTSTAFHCLPYCPIGRALPSCYRTSPKEHAISWATLFATMNFLPLATSCRYCHPGHPSQHRHHVMRISTAQYTTARRPAAPKASQDRRPDMIISHLIADTLQTVNVCATQRSANSSTDERARSNRHGQGGDRDGREPS